MVKKKTSSKSSTSSKKTKTVTRRLSSAKKATSKKTRSKKASAKKGRKTTASKTRKSSSKKKDPNSVDGILKKFVQERSSLDVHLAALEKKIADLEKKTKLYQEQLVSLAQDKEATVDSIAQIDTRRDLEVSQLLSRLGVKVTEVAPPAVATTVVFDVKPSEEVASGHDQNNSEDRYSDESEDE